MTRPLAAIVGAAALLRLYIFLLSPVIPADAAAYLSSAKEIAESGLDAGLRLWNLHPLYPLLVFALGLLGGDLAVWATLLSVAAGAAAAVPLHAFFRLWWDERTALAAALLYALHPILAPQTGEPLPTAVLFLCFTGALALGFRAFRGGPFWMFPAAGACAALAYLTRTEGLLAGLLLLAAAGVELFRKGADRRRLALGGAAALLAGVALAAPYVVYVSAQAGRFAITAKGGGTVLLNAFQGRPLALPGADDSFPFFTTVQRKLTYAFFAPLLPFLVAGLVLERREARRRILPLLIAAAPLLPPILLFALNRHFRPSHRYFLVSAALFLPWSAAAMLKLIDVLRPRVPAAVTAALLATLLLGKNVLPHRPEDRGLREAGAWLASNPPEAGRWTLLSTSDKISWYAGARHVAVFPPEPAALLELCRSAGAAAVAVDERARRELPPGFVDELRKLGCATLREFPHDARSVGVILLRPPPP